MARACEEIVQADDIVAFLDQAFTQMGAEKSGSARDQYACMCLQRDSFAVRARNSTMADGQTHVVYVVG